MVGFRFRVSSFGGLWDYRFPKSKAKATINNIGIVHC